MNWMYLTHSRKREEIARQGQERVLKEHTYRDRMVRMISIIDKSLEGNKTNWAS